ncbi:hypothetical protein BTO32_14945 [Marinobacter lutaoensis]|uniref:Uncharacterized protein n=1 Tax=Marinobacter lutaoensis TaxID=135739 RepID=A0A1V2DPB5_9GAMM|nr:hypothetical protein [Marinobacter lutaoensis]ONF42508.1 hypothetical protein BTO32_14945 [Marinobacter lutaoensis]
MTSDHLNSGEILCLELDDQALDDLITLLNENLQSIERKYEAAIESKKLAQSVSKCSEYSKFVCCSITPPLSPSNNPGSATIAFPDSLC